jgi:hypothetical protein
MRTHFLHLCRVVVYSLVAILFAGCYSVHQGQFVAERAEGWSMQQAAGSTFFDYPTKHTPNWYIQIGGAGKTGKLHLRIGSAAYDPDAIYKLLSFSGSPIRIKFADQNRETVISTDGFQTVDGQDLYIGGSQDVTVIIPSFKIGDNVVPELSAHMHWSNGKYRIWHAELM